MSEIFYISLIQLIQHPDQFHLQKVRVIGFACLKFEGKSIYVSKQDFENAITKNAIWLDIGLTEDIKKYHETYVLVEGVFDKDNLGHLKLYSGSIKDLQRIEHWEGQKK